MTFTAGFLLFIAGYICGCAITRNAELRRRQERIEKLTTAVRSKWPVVELAKVNKNLASWLN